MINNNDNENKGTKKFKDRLICSICLRGYDIREIEANVDSNNNNANKSRLPYRLLICSHVFHKECIEKWFEVSGSNDKGNIKKCALCRQDYSSFLNNDLILIYEPTILQTLKSKHANNSPLSTSSLSSSSSFTSISIENESSVVERIGEEQQGNTGNSINLTLPQNQHPIPPPRRNKNFIHNFQNSFYNCTHCNCFCSVGDIITIVIIFAIVSLIVIFFVMVFLRKKTESD